MRTIWALITEYPSYRSFSTDFWAIFTLIMFIIFAYYLFSILRIVRRDRRRSRINSLPHNVVHTTGQNIATLTEQCYRIGTQYSSNNIPIVNQRQPTVWERTQQELMNALNAAHDRNHSAILRARNLHNTTEQIMDMINISTVLERQTNICRGCRNRQNNDRFVCNLADSRNIAGMDENGNIHIN